MKFRIQYLLILISITSVIGCSTSIPLSEAYIFTKNEVRKDSLKWSSSGLVGYASNNNTPAIKKYIRSQSDESIRERDFWNLNKNAYSFSYARNEQDVAWGINVGYRALGANVTLGIGWNSYTTINASVLGGAELIFQRKLVHKAIGDPKGGLTIGIFGKRDYFAYSRDGAFSGTGFGFIHILGGRSMFHIRHKKYAGHGFVSYGYSPELSGAILNIGFSFGADVFK